MAVLALESATEPHQDVQKGRYTIRVYIPTERGIMNSKQSKAEKAKSTVLRFRNHPPVRIHGGSERLFLLRRTCNRMGYLRAHRNQNGDWLLWYEISPWSWSKNSDPENEFIGIFQPGMDIFNSEAWKMWNESPFFMETAEGGGSGVEIQLDSKGLAQAQIWLETLGLSTVQEF